MPVYAPDSDFASHRRHPSALLVIIAGHAALLAAVMSARMDLPARIIPQVTEVTLVEPPEPPPPDQPPPPKRPASPRDSAIDRPPVVVPAPPLDLPAADPAPLPAPVPADAVVANSLLPTPGPVPVPVPVPGPVRTGPRFATSASLVRPPYPPEKLRSGEEAVLRLRLSIDSRGRVAAVDPVGPADRAFLDAARRHIIARWRYKPATEAGRAVAATTVVTLAFRIEE